MAAGIEIYSDENSLQLSDKSLSFMMVKKTTLTFDAKTSGEKGDVHTTDRQRQGSTMVMPTRRVYTNYDMDSADNILCFTATKCSGRCTQGKDYKNNDYRYNNDIDQVKNTLNPPYVVAITKKDHEQFGDLRYEVYCNVFDPSRMGTDSITITIFEFSVRPKTVSNYGLQIYADDGSLVYDSSNRLLRILRSINLPLEEYAAGNNYTAGKMVLHADYFDHEQSKVVGGCYTGVVNAIRASENSARRGTVDFYRTFWCFSTNQAVSMSSATRKAKNTNFPQFYVYLVTPYTIRVLYSDLTNY